MKKLVFYDIKHGLEIQSCFHPKERTRNTIRPLLLRYHPVEKKKKPRLALMGRFIMIHDVLSIKTLLSSGEKSIKCSITIIFPSCWRKILASKYTELSKNPCCT
jgi:hypothetical protein